MADEVQHAADTDIGAGWRPQLKHALATVFLVTRCRATRSTSCA